MPHLIQRQRPAMGTWFGVRLVGDDPEHLAAVADAVLDEVERIERLLSRFDRRSEVARINREAGSRPVLVDREVLDVLLTCKTASERTEGYFDVTAGRGTIDAVTIDSEARTVRFDKPGVALDLGGIGKGYALDRGAVTITAQGVESAVLHGGTSSVIAFGCDETGRPWTVGVRAPFVPHDQAAELFQVRLSGRGFSCSATRAPGQVRSDVVDPHTGQAIEGRSSCVVIARDATRAEILSTALLSMGKDRANTYFSRYAEAEAIESAWIECSDGQPLWYWLT
jgi:thiamine biosynthesis lipoprotein